MIQDEALRFLAYSAKIKHSEHLMIPEFVRHNEEVAQAANILTLALGINFEMPSSPPQSEDQK